MPPLHSHNPECFDDLQVENTREPVEPANESNYTLEIASRTTEELLTLRKALMWRVQPGNGTPESSIARLNEHITQLDLELSREERRGTI